MLAFVWLCLPALASMTENQAGPEDPGSRVRGGRVASKQRRQPIVRMPRIIPTPRPHVDLATGKATASVGEHVFVTVRMVGGGPTTRHASFSIGADPAVLRYVGFAATGRGALVAQEHPTVHGLVGVYRSSLPEGFAPVEEIAVLEYVAVAAGSCSFVLSDVRVMDSSARDFVTTFGSGYVDVQ